MRGQHSSQTSPNKHSNKQSLTGLPVFYQSGSNYVWSGLPTAISRLNRIHRVATFRKDPCIICWMILFFFFWGLVTSSVRQRSAWMHSKGRKHFLCAGLPSSLCCWPTNKAKSSSAQGLCRKITHQINNKQVRVYHFIQLLMCKSKTIQSQQKPNDKNRQSDYKAKKKKPSMTHES